MTLMRYSFGQLIRRIGRDCSQFHKPVLYSAMNERSAFVGLNLGGRRLPALLIRAKSSDEWNAQLTDIRVPSGVGALEEARLESRLLHSLSFFHPPIEPRMP